MIIFALALPIIIADCHSRKIPNIYLYFYTYVGAMICVVKGFSNLILLLLVIAILALLHLCGMGMGDSKLIALIVVLLQFHGFTQFSSLLISIAFVSGVEISLYMVVFKVVARTIAMAPSIFIGTALYLATRAA